MISSLKGTQDILPPESGFWKYIENICRNIYAKYGYEEIRTPIIEPKALFERGVGKDTDIVQKQMYAFTDQGGRDICLRPEQTASVVRAYIEHDLSKTQQFVKLFYFGPMYRSERPQAGRQREFYQTGVEILGTYSPYADCEIIILLEDILKQLFLSDYKLKLNSLGCSKDKEKFKKQLKGILKPQIKKLCQDCQDRYSTNILRILDCKNEVCKNNLRMLNIDNSHLCEECAAHFNKVKGILNAENISFEFDPFLVRGLDYYTKTVFEVIAQGLGAQSAVAAGGRYDNLVSDLGGQETGSCGFAIGFERLISIIDKEKLKYSAPCAVLFIVAMNEASYKEAFALQNKLRKKGISCDMDYQARSLKAQMRYADKKNAKFVAVIGDDELKTQEVNLKNMKTGEQQKVNLNQLADFLNNFKL
ncbi:MAG: histidine--tRNA ligase [Candidatus Omnitrophota bacterium]